MDVLKPNSIADEFVITQVGPKAFPCSKTEATVTKEKSWQQGSHCSTSAANESMTLSACLLYGNIWHGQQTSCSPGFILQVALEGSRGRCWEDRGLQVARCMGAGNFDYASCEVIGSTMPKSSG